MGAHHAASALCVFSLLAGVKDIHSANYGVIAQVTSSLQLYFCGFNQRSIRALNRLAAKMRPVRHQAAVYPDHIFFSGQNADRPSGELVGRA